MYIYYKTLILVIFFTFLTSCAHTKSIIMQDQNSQMQPIQEMAWVELGGVKQFVLLRGKDRSKPVLLYLHGGPGSPETGWMRYFHSWLEDYFVVALWEQRGSGKSFRYQNTNEELNPRQIVDDGVELAQYLKKRFGQKKIFLMGTSWGGMLGMYMIQKAPENFASFVAISPGVNFVEGEKRSYEFVLEEAKKRNNKKAVRDLLAIGAPVNGLYVNNPVDSIMLQRKWARKFGAMTHNPDAMSFKLIRKLLFADEYSLLDSIRLYRGMKYNLKSTVKFIPEVNLFREVPSVKVPVHFMIGKYERIVSFDLVKDYYKQLQAPEKTFTAFENSAHAPLYEEADVFKNKLIEIYHLQ